MPITVIIILAINSILYIVIITRVVNNILTETIS